MRRKDRKLRKEKKKQSESNAQKVIDVLDGSFLAKENIIKQWPFMLTVTLLLMALITNTYIAESYNRKIGKADKLLRDLHAKDVELKASLMETSLQSVLIKKLDGTGVKESLDPVYKIEYNNSANEKEEQK